MILHLYSICYYFVLQLGEIYVTMNQAIEKSNSIYTIDGSSTCTVFVFAWGVSNTGTACRHRDKMTIIWGLILALTYSPTKYNYKKQ